MRVAFHENDRNHENNKNDKDNSESQTATNKEFNAGLAEITETTQMTKTTGMRGANHGFLKTTRLGIPEQTHQILPSFHTPIEDGSLRKDPICRKAPFDTEYDRAKAPPYNRNYPTLPLEG